jgi:outer membrane receptor protein involved in Fe transport
MTPRFAWWTLAANQAIRSQGSIIDSSRVRKPDLWTGAWLLCNALPAAANPAATSAAPAAVTTATAATTNAADELSEVTVTAARLRLIGSATTASEGVVVNDELALLPAYRPGQLLETVPGLDVTSHSGEGKANQYLMRGYNLDHGTDLAIFVDGMPVNEPTHAHGQGYSDVNFLIPDLATDISYTKGTYYADEGDFASVGSVHINYLDTIAAQASVTAGTLGFQRVFTADSTQLGAGNLLGAVELQHYDGPWVHADDQRKVNTVLRYSEGDAQDGYSITSSYYHGLWNSSTDQPQRAIDEGLISRFGELDPSDGGVAQRANLTGQYHAPVGPGQLDVDAYAFSNYLILWNDFTHFLVDPLNGDQEEQHENRSTVGGSVSYAFPTQWFGVDSDLSVGTQERYDFLIVQRIPTEDRVAIPLSDDPEGAMSNDQVRLESEALYAQATTHWTDWFRSVVGLRGDYQRGTDVGTFYGKASKALFEPKASLIFRPAEATEFYLSGGRGFHSDDLRGVNEATITNKPGAPLIAEQTGGEIGMRQELFGRKVSVTLALFNLDAQSETTYDPDVGEDSAGPGSRRYGYEINLTYQALRWLELYGSLSQDHARYTSLYNDGTGHVGYYLPNAPFATGSFTAYVKDSGPWSGSLALRYLGAYPLSSDDAVQGHGYHEWNGDVRYALGSGWGVALGVYNMLNTHANAMEYWYIDRLPGEPAAGVADVHIHPLEPISARLTLSKKF